MEPTGLRKADGSNDLLAFIDPESGLFRLFYKKSILTAMIFRSRAKQLVEAKARLFYCIPAHNKADRIIKLSAGCFTFPYRVLCNPAIAVIDSQSLKRNNIRLGEARECFQDFLHVSVYIDDIIIGKDQILPRRILQGHVSAFGQASFLSGKETD